MKNQRNWEVSNLIYHSCPKRISKILLAVHPKPCQTKEAAVSHLRMAAYLTNKVLEVVVVA